MQDNVTVIDYSVSPPDFLLEYYDAKTGIVTSTTINSKDLSFFLEDGTKLVLQEDGSICLPDRVFSEHSIPITASYVHSDGQTYEASFTVLLYDLTIETPYFSILLPRDWKGKYFYTYRFEGPEDFWVCLYESKNYYAAKEENLFTQGKLATICLYSKEDKSHVGGSLNHDQEDIYELPLEYKGCCSIDGITYDIIAIHPTDVQFIYDGQEDESYWIAYNELFDDMIEDQENDDPKTDHVQIGVYQEYICP